VITKKDRWYISLIIVAVVLLTTLPYIYAVNNGGEEYTFSGFLLNPLDGNSYLAKMYQGWRGDWLFTLPFTAEIGRGAFLFMFYLFLGHLSRAIGFELLWTFHLARILGGIFLCVVLYKALITTIHDWKLRRMAYLLLLIGAGLGWLAVPFGVITSDFWVAEAYPFLSVYVNPHFPFGLSLLMIVILPGIIKVYPIGEKKWLVGGIILIFISFILAIVQPFGVVLACIILAVLAIWEVYPHLTKLHLSLHLQRLLWVVFGAVPLLFYEVWVINTDPLLSIWNAQNQTPSPPLWDIIVSLSPVLILVILGIPRLIKEESWAARLAITWTLSGLFLLYVPWGLQRRFMLGIYIPLVILAFLWLGFKKLNQRHYFLLVTLLVIFSIPTNLLVLLAARHGAQTRDPTLYLAAEEVDAFNWIEDNTSSEALILAAPNTGLFIPAHTGRRVFYGHPFETVDAEEMEALVTRFFQGESLEDDLSNITKADFLFFGPREKQIGGNLPTLEYSVVYQNQEVTIYKMGK
jgi:hypothetical protein